MLLIYFCLALLTIKSFTKYDNVYNHRLFTKRVKAHTIKSTAINMKLFNTLGRKLEEFTPLRRDKQVGLYTCGPTVYAQAHLGNLRTYVFEDVLKRTLVTNGYTVKYVMNITDVGHLTSDEDAGEDKVEKAAVAEKKSAHEIADYYTQLFKKDLEDLNILPPDEWVKATDCIEEQKFLVKQLKDKGFTYKTSDGIYFDTSKLDNYGALDSNRLAGQQSGKRIDMGEKKNPTDFALWKFSPEGSKRQMEWEYDGRMGFPGWHLECSAISQQAFKDFNPDQSGPWFDIHCGGIDHIAIHHTNEIVQTYAATGRLLAKYWLHGEFLVAGEKRMGKSEGNTLTLKELSNKGIESLAYRYFLLQAHYRSPLTFSWEALEAAQRGLQSLYDTISQLGEAKNVIDEYYNRFLESINDDLNTTKGLAIMQELLNSQEDSGNKAATIKKMDEVLGLKLLDYKIPEAPTEVKALANEREQARQNKNWQRADELRAQINDMGWDVDDTTQGPKLKLKR